MRSEICQLSFSTPHVRTQPTEAEKRLWYSKYPAHTGVVSSKSSRTEIPKTKLAFSCRAGQIWVRSLTWAPVIIENHCSTNIVTVSLLVTIRLSILRILKNCGQFARGCELVLSSVEVWNFRNDLLVVFHNHTLSIIGVTMPIRVLPNVAQYQLKSTTYVNLYILNVTHDTNISYSTSMRK